MLFPREKFCEPLAMSEFPFSKIHISIQQAKTFKSWCLAGHIFPLVLEMVLPLANVKQEVRSVQPRVKCTPVWFHSPEGFDFHKP
jgi:hypothetical protein